MNRRGDVQFSQLMVSERTPSRKESAAPRGKSGSARIREYKHGNDVVGSVEHGEGKLYNIKVHPEYRRQGVSQGMLNDVAARSGGNLELGTPFASAGGEMMWRKWSRGRE